MKNRGKKREKRSIQRDVVGKKRRLILTDSLSSEIDEAPVNSLDSLALHANFTLAPVDTMHDVDTMTPQTHAAREEET